MSNSMWTWRVIVPGLGLITCLFLLRDWPRPGASTSAPASKPGHPDSTTGRVIAEGRIVARPGADVTIGSETGGTVVAVHRPERSAVRKGDVLVEFRAEDLRLALVEAEARLTEATAELSYHQGEYRRKAKATTGAVQFVAELDASRRDLDVALSRRKVAEVAVSRARAALDRAAVHSPIDGVVVATYVTPGEVKAPGDRLAEVCDLARLRVEAEVDEFDLARIQEGDEVIVRAEGYAETNWPGTIEEIPDRVAGRALRPDDPGRPSDTRVVLVKIGLKTPVTLKLGQQVRVEIRPGVRPVPGETPAAPPGRPSQPDRSK